MIISLGKNFGKCLCATCMYIMSYTFWGHVLFIDKENLEVGGELSTSQLYQFCSCMDSYIYLHASITTRVNINTCLVCKLPHAQTVSVGIQVGIEY